MGSGSRSMFACRSCALIRWAILCSPQRKASGLSAIRRDSNFFHSGHSKGDSAVYRHALLFQRPAFVEPRPPLCNSVSFIGTVVFDPRIVESQYSGVGAYTSLNVETPAHSRRAFRILLQMWGDLARISLEHLKTNDFIYVSGFLGSFENVDADGRRRLNYKVSVKELNYVLPCTGGQAKSVKSESQGGIYGLGKREERLHLWHIYFASPHEWWDNRKEKKFPEAPDFKHKDTGESLWLKSDDPPWVRKQLQLLDSRMSELAGTHLTRGRVSPWVYDG